MEISSVDFSAVHKENSLRNSPYRKEAPIFQDSYSKRPVLSFLETPQTFYSNDLRDTREIKTLHPYSSNNFRQPESKISDNYVSEMRYAT
jgi:hypothetical protein